MQNLSLKGIWIQIEILTDKKLSDKEKIIYAIIIYLSKENDYCYCTNKTISELLNITVTQVSRLVNSLKDKNYINIELINKYNNKNINKYNSTNKNHKKSKSNFEERDYTGFDFTKLYANAYIIA